MEATMHHGSVARSDLDAENGDDAFLVLRDLHKGYGGTPAVIGATLSARRGEILVLLGPSGCGKTTTLNMIAGFVRPDRGRILLNDRDITHLSVQRRRVGMVFQGNALFPHMSAFENVAYGLRRQRVPKADIKRRVAEKLDVVGLSGMADRLPGDLSGGQQQRVALARALIIEPDVLLLDEPLSALDAKLRVEMREEIRSLVDIDDVTAVLVTHDQEEALSLADTIAVMESGVVRQVGTPRELYSEPADRFVAGFLGETVTFPGEVVSVDGTRITMKSGQHVIRGEARGDVPAVGDQVLALVRPECVTVDESVESTEDIEANRWRGRLRSQVFLGSASRLVFEGTTRVSLTVTGARPLSGDGELQLRWNASDTKVFATQ